MLPRELESLRERLLRAGVGPRHVRRYLRELQEHYEDVLRAELAKGADLSTARQSARARLGSEDELAQSMLVQPELRSTAARFPALVFGAGPLLAWLGTVLASICLLQLLPQRNAAAAPPPGWLIDGAYALCLLYARILPVLLGLVVLAAASRRRVRARWPVAGIALVDLFAGTLTIQLLTASAQGPGLGVSSSLLPLLVPFSDSYGPRDLLAFGGGLLRGACLLAVSLAAHHFRMPAWLTSESR